MWKRLFVWWEEWPPAQCAFNFVVEEAFSCGGSGFQPRAASALGGRLSASNFGVVGRRWLAACGTPADCRSQCKEWVRARRRAEGKEPAAVRAALPPTLCAAFLQPCLPPVPAACKPRPPPPLLLVASRSVCLAIDSPQSLALAPLSLGCSPPLAPFRHSCWLAPHMFKRFGEAAKAARTKSGSSPRQRVLRSRAPLSRLNAGPFLSPALSLAPPSPHALPRPLTDPNFRGNLVGLPSRSTAVERSLHDLGGFSLLHDLGGSPQGLSPRLGRSAWGLTPRAGSTRLGHPLRLSFLPGRKEKPQGVRLFWGGEAFCFPRKPEELPRSSLHELACLGAAPLTPRST